MVTAGLGGFRFAPRRPGPQVNNVWDATPEHSQPQERLTPMIQVNGTNELMIQIHEAWFTLDGTGHLALAVAMMESLLPFWLPLWLPDYRFRIAIGL